MFASKCAIFFWTTLYLIDSDPRKLDEKIWWTLVH